MKLQDRAYCGFHGLRVEECWVSKMVGVQGCSGLETEGLRPSDWRMVTEAKFLFGLVR